MEENRLFSSANVGLHNSTVLLDYDYKKLGREVSNAVIACPALFSLMRQRDLSLLTLENASMPEIHMRACVRMTCALIGLKDPYPRNKSTM